MEKDRSTRLAWIKQKMSFYFTTTVPVGPTGRALKMELGRNGLKWLHCDETRGGNFKNFFGSFICFHYCK